MTVLIVIAFFALFILADYAVTRGREAREAGVPVPDAAPEPVWVAGYQVPDALYYHRGHAWARPVGRSSVLIGLDDFARRLTGPARELKLPALGDWLIQGGPGFDVKVDGRDARFVSPVEGEVVAVNAELRANPALATSDPYGRGWVMKVRSPHLAANLRNLLSGRLARRWAEDAREALDLRLMALSGSVLQDGGEPVADFARHLPAEDWQRLVREFLLT
jgi:glycine cleavage system H lipoate-binding protein